MPGLLRAETAGEEAEEEANLSDIQEALAAYDLLIHRYDELYRKITLVEHELHRVCKIE